MIQQQELITNQQKGLLKLLEKYQPVLQFQSLADIQSSSMHNINVKQSQENNNHHLNRRQNNFNHHQVQNNQQNTKLSKSITFHSKNSFTLRQPISKAIKKTQSFVLSSQSHNNNNNNKENKEKNVNNQIYHSHKVQNQKQHQHINQPKHSTTTLHFLQNQLQKQTTPTYIQLKSRLLQYKQQSQRIYIVSQFIHSYQQNFTLLNAQKDKLLSMLKEIKGQTTELVNKQKCLIDMSMAVKQALDYYTYYTKSQFNYACEIASRQLFQDTLQPTLSTIMDAIQFFTENQSYVQSRKHLNFYLSSKSKILSFIKSFFIKLLNKQNSFIIKHISQNHIYEQMNTLYPKSRLKLIKSFLLTYPLLKNKIKQLTKLSKQANTNRQQHQQQLNYLQLREMQIEQFILSQSNIGLVKYLEKNNYEIYSEVMLNLFTFNRFNFHQNLIFYCNKRIVGGEGNRDRMGRNTAGNKESTAGDGDKEKKSTAQTQTSLNTTMNTTNNSSKQPIPTSKQRLHHFHCTLHFITQTIITEYIYILATCNPSTPTSIQFITTWLYKLTMKYLQTVVVKQIRQLLLRYKVDPFQICEMVNVLVDHQLKAYLGNLLKQQYRQTYVMGVLYSCVQKNNINTSIYNNNNINNNLVNSNTKITNMKEQQSQKINNPNSTTPINPHTQFLHQLFTNTIKTKLLNQLQSYCHQNLPKLQLTNQKYSLQQNINLLINYIPKLVYCPKQADNYLITSLDVLIKSIKQINLSIQSRFQCYVWNLIAFGKLKNVLNAKKLQLVSKQIRLDFNQSLNIIDKVKRLQRPQSLIKYAQDIFNVIKTGIPSLNYLTLDYNKYINQHYDQLQSRFLKDILFIYAKNIIQFLQKVIDTKKRLALGLEREIKSRKNLQQSLKQQQVTKQSSMIMHNNQVHNTTIDANISNNQIMTKSDQKSPKSMKQLQKSPKQLQKSPKQKNTNKPQNNNELYRLCESQPMKSLYSSYLHSIEKYIKQSKQILQTIKQCKILNNQKQLKNINNLIREVYEKLFDFLDTFYVTVSEFNSQITAEFQQIAVIKQRQQALWMEKVVSRSMEKVMVIEE